MKNLIVNADDLGWTAGVNRGIAEAHRHGIVTSASLLANGSAFASGVEVARSTPGLGVGVHLNLSDGAPVAARELVTSLVNDAGEFASGPENLLLRIASRGLALHEVEQEWEAQIEKVRDASGGWEPREIDIGGGFAVPRDPLGRSDRRRLAAPNAPSIAEYAKAITRALRDGLTRIGMSTAIRLEIEPGRSIYGNAGIHLASVTNIKHQAAPLDHTWIETDTSDSFLPDVNLERNRWTVCVAGRATARPTAIADVVGISCNFDVIVPAANLPEVRVGDILAFLDTGAYQDANATNFNAMPRPATVLVTGDQSELVKRAETIEDVFARDIIPERLARK